MGLIVTIAVYVAALLATGAVAFSAVLALAGPHGGILPTSLHGVVLANAWVLVLVVPAFAARWAWRRQRRSARMP